MNQRYQQPADTIHACPVHRQNYRAAIRQARQRGPHAFHAWFNRAAATSMQQHLVRGYWDFSLHILTPQVCRYLAQPETKTALEIGSGGGRLLNAACRYFGHAIGIDIHTEHATAAAFLREQGHTNFTLLSTDGAHIPCAAACIDFIYSFIVFQHVPSYTVFVSYIQEIARCLRPGGVAQVYFGKFARLHPLYRLLYGVQGYKATPNAPANHISLVVRVAKARRLCRQVGLRVVAVGTSSFLAPDGYPRKAGGQNYITLVKPVA